VRIFSWLRRVPVIFQNEAGECGAICLAMIASYYGRDIDRDQIRSEARTSTRGRDLRSLIALALEWQIGSRILRGEPENLKQIRRPAILHWKFDHFVVLTSVGKRGVVLHDPAIGRIVASWAEVSAHFTGVLIECWPRDDFPVRPRAQVRSKTLTLTDIARSIRGHGRTLCGLLTITLLLQICILVAPLQVQWVIDEALVRADLDLLVTLLLGFGLVLLLRAVSEALSSWLTACISAHLTLSLGQGLFDHLLRLPMRWFVSRHSGDIVSRFSSLIPVRETLASGIVALIVDVVLVVGSLIMLFVYNTFLTWIVVATTIFVVLVRTALYPACLHKRPGPGKPQIESLAAVKCTLD
jgi:ATP-binding cassette subfamily B protein RaxB